MLWGDGYTCMYTVHLYSESYCRGAWQNFDLFDTFDKAWLEDAFKFHNLFESRRILAPYDLQIV